MGDGWVYDICTISIWCRNLVHEHPVVFVLFFWICRSWENQSFRCFVGDPQVELPPLSSARKSQALRVFGGMVTLKLQETTTLLHMNTYDKRGWPQSRKGRGSAAFTEVCVAQKPSSIFSVPSRWGKASERFLMIPKVLFTMGSHSLWMSIRSILYI